MDPDPLARVANAIHEHPRFDDAVAHYVENILVWRHQLGGFNKIISSYARINIIGYVMFLHFANETGNPDNGATFERLASLCLMREQCGPRVLRTVLVVANATGYLHTERGRFDRRLKLYQPTEKLMARIRQWCGHMLACFDFLVDGQGFARRPSDEPGFVGRMMSTSGRAVVERGLLIGEHFEDLYPILCLDGGFATMIAVVGARLRGQPAPSHQEIGKRFRFSASQARKILKLAEERDLVAFSDEGRVADASGLVELCRRYIARELSMYAKYSLGLETYFVKPAPSRFSTLSDAPSAAARRR